MRREYAGCAAGFFFEDLRALQGSGVKPVIVHGGGPAISDNLAKLGIESSFVNGLRVTTEEVLDVVEMTLAGSINKAIVRRIQGSGGQALGLSGVDGNLILARPVANSDEVGQVGEVIEVKAEIVKEFSHSATFRLSHRSAWMLRGSVTILMRIRRRERWPLLSNRLR